MVSYFVFLYKKIINKGPNCQVSQFSHLDSNTAGKFDFLVSIIEK